MEELQINKVYINYPNVLIIHKKTAKFIIFRTGYAEEYLWGEAGLKYKIKWNDLEYKKKLIIAGENDDVVMVVVDVGEIYFKNYDYVSYIILDDDKIYN